MEISQLLEQLDLPQDLLLEEKTIEDFKSAFDAKFLAKDVAHTDPKVKEKIAGAILGAATVKLQQLGGLTGGDTKGKKLEEVIEMIGEKFNTELTTLKEAAGKGNDEKVLALAEEKEKAIKEAKKYKELADNLGTNLENTNKDWEDKFKGYKINSQLEKVKSGIKFKDDIKEVERIGFETLLGSKYKFSLGEGDKFEVTDSNGEPIPNSKKTGFLSPSEVIELEAMNQGLRKMNNADPAKKEPVIVKHTNGAATPATDGRKVHPSAAAPVQQNAIS